MKKIIFILLFILTLTTILYAQIIDIRDFKGLWTNADLEDIPLEYVTELQNLRPVNGKLVKTFAFGDKITTAVTQLDSYTVRNFITFIQSELNGGVSGNEDWLYMMQYINDTNNSMILYGWYPATSSWTQIAGMPPYIYYHNKAKNPIIQENEIIRFLPGNIDSVGSNVSEGFMLTHISNKFFDDHYAPSPDFYRRPTTINEPNIDFTLTELDSGFFNEPQNYRFSYIYDGLQESLLDSGLTFFYDSLGFGKFDFYIEKAEHNRRVTSMNIYRSDEPDGIYNIIHTIDFLRDTLQTLSGDSAFNGGYYIYLANNTYSQSANTRITIGFRQYGIPSLTYNVINEGSGIYNIFKVRQDTSHPSGNRATLPVPNDYWNSSYNIWENGILKLKKQSGSFSGSNVVTVENDLGNHLMAKGVLEYNESDTITYRLIDKNYKRAIGFKGDSLRYDSVKSWRATSLSKGNYFCSQNGDSVLYEFFDTGLIEGEEYPLLGEVSININGKYAKVIGGRLWQGYIILDPGGANETHENWVSYSELGQYDVNPVSNIITFSDIGVGEISGIAEIYGNPVILKNNAITLINIKNYPNNPENWSVIQSVHNIGNIADDGYIVVRGKLYVVYYDGIYALSPNNLAETDMTPVEMLKITEPIEDIYQDLTLILKKQIVSEYDQSKSEIIFTFGTTDTSDVYAYNVAKGMWREIDNDKTIILMALDENANILVYDSTVSKIYSFEINDTVKVKYKTKTFDISNSYNQASQLNYFYITYKSASSLTLNLFTENSDTVKKAYELPAYSVITTYMGAFLYGGAKKFNLQLIDSLNSNTNIEIGEIKVSYIRNE